HCPPPPRPVPPRCRRWLDRCRRRWSLLRVLLNQAGPGGGRGRGLKYGASGQCDPPPRPPSSRSTYLASTSTSRLTGSPSPSPPRIVASRVVGMRETSNHASGSPPGLTADTVSEVPETVIDPFSTTYRERSTGNETRTTCQ